MPNILLSPAQVNDALDRGQGGAQNYLLPKNSWHVATIDTSQVKEDPVLGANWARLDGFRFKISYLPPGASEPITVTIFKNMFTGELVHLARALGVPVERDQGISFNTADLEGQQVGIRVYPRKDNQNVERNEIGEFVPAADVLAKKAS